MWRDDAEPKKNYEINMNIQEKNVHGYLIWLQIKKYSSSQNFGTIFTERANNSEAAKLTLILMGSGTWVTPSAPPRVGVDNDERPHWVTDRCI